MIYIAKLIIAQLFKIVCSFMKPVLYYRAAKDNFLEPIVSKLNPFKHFSLQYYTLNLYIFKIFSSLDGLMWKRFVHFSYPHLRPTCPAYLTLLDLVTPIIFHKEQTTLMRFTFSPKFLSASFLNTTCRVSHKSGTTDNSIVKNEITQQTIHIARAVSQLRMCECCTKRQYYLWL
jgi:hypothetical protein